MPARCDKDSVRILGERRNFVRWSAGMREKAKSNAQLNRVHAGIGRTESGIGNVHVANLSAPIEFVAEKVKAEGTAGREINAGSSRRYGVAREERAAADFHVRNHRPMPGEIPFQGERIYARAISGASVLNDQKSGNRFDSVFELAAEDARAVRRGEHPAVTQTDIENPGPGRTAAHPTPTAGPDLQFVTAIFWAGLRAERGRAAEQGEERSYGNCRSIHESLLELLWIRRGDPTVQERYRNFAAKANLI
jgi:hypothetical protein